MREPVLISVVDDDESVRDSTKALLRSAGYRVQTFESGEQFLGSGALAGTACLILDVRMTGMDGLEVQRRVNASDPDVPIIFISAHEKSRRLAMKGTASFFHKPFVTRDLLAAIETVLRPEPVGQMKPGGGGDLQIPPESLKGVVP